MKAANNAQIDTVRVVWPDKRAREDDELAMANAIAMTEAEPW